jgi:hypothetical protein
LGGSGGGGGGGRGGGHVGGIMGVKDTALEALLGWEQLELKAVTRLPSTSVVRQVVVVHVVFVVVVVVTFSLSLYICIYKYVCRVM